MKLVYLDATSCAMRLKITRRSSYRNLDENLMKIFITYLAFSIEKKTLVKCALLISLSPRYSVIIR